MFGELEGVKNGHKTPSPEFVSALLDEEIIEKASAAENSEKFLRLWAGDTSGYEQDDNDGHSEADLALSSSARVLSDLNLSSSSRSVLYLPLQLPPY